MTPKNEAQNRTLWEADVRILSSWSKPPFEAPQGSPSPHSTPQIKETNTKQDKKKRPSLPFILPSKKKKKKKRVSDALAASSSPFLPAGVPSALLSQRPRLYTR
jgi:hypothetical protein